MIRLCSNLQLVQRKLSQQSLSLINFIQTKSISNSSTNSPAVALPTLVPMTSPVMKLVELSNLEEATSRFTFQSLPYGSAPNVLFPRTPYSSNFNCNFFTLKAFPSVPHSNLSHIDPSSRTHRPSPPPSLHHTTSVEKPFLSKEEIRSRQIGLKRYKSPYVMNLTIMAGKKKVHKSAVIRERCKRRIKEAIRMVVVRGASQNHDSKMDIEELKFSVEEEGPKKWLVPGHTYILTATLELYRCSFPALIEQVRKALKQIKINGENHLYQRCLDQIPAPPPDNIDQSD